MWSRWWLNRSGDWLIPDDVWFLRVTLLRGVWWLDSGFLKPLFIINSSSRFNTPAYIKNHALVKTIIKSNNIFSISWRTDVKTEIPIGKRLEQTSRITCTSEEGIVPS